MPIFKAPASSGGSGGVLAVKDYLPTTSVTTTSSTFSDVSAANLVVTFTAPSSGKVQVQLSAMVASNGATTYAWNLRDGSGDISGTKRAINFNGSTASQQRYGAMITVTGLTPGTSYTWKWGHGVTFGSSTVGIGGSASEENTATMTVLALP